MVIPSRGDGEGSPKCARRHANHALLLEYEHVFAKSLASLGMTRVFVSLAQFAMRRKESA